MISRYSYQGLSWIDLESPTRDEAMALSEEHDLHPVVTSELIEPSERSKVDVYNESIFLVLHFPIHSKTAGHVEEIEVDFVLTKKSLITAHYSLVEPLHEFARIFEIGSFLDNGKEYKHPGFLLYFALRELYKHTLYIVDSVGHEIREIEKHIFAGDENAMVARISKTNRSLIDVKQALRYHREALSSLTPAVKTMYGDDFSYYIDAIHGEFARIEQSVDEHRQTLRDLRETNDSLLSAKTNATIRRLTAINVILFPLGFITWVFAMDSDLLRLNEPRQLFTVFGAMALILITSSAYFRAKKWL